MTVTRSTPPPKPKRCYAWIHSQGTDAVKKCTTTTLFRCPSCGRAACSQHRELVPGSSTDKRCLGCIHTIKQNPRVQVSNRPTTRYHESELPPMARLRPNPLLKKHTQKKSVAKPVKLRQVVASPQSRRVQRPQKIMRPIQIRQKMKHPSRIVRGFAAIGRVKRRADRIACTIKGIAKYIPFTRANRRHVRRLEQQHERVRRTHYGLKPVQSRRRKRRK